MLKRDLVSFKSYFNPLASLNTTNYLGTGKTATFAISALQIIDGNFLQCQAIILAPTRDLAQQIHEVVSAMGINLGLKILACIGGTTEAHDLKALREGVHIVIGINILKFYNC